MCFTSPTANALHTKWWSPEAPVMWPAVKFSQQNPTLAAKYAPPTEQKTAQQTLANRDNQRSDQYVAQLNQQYQNRPVYQMPSANSPAGAVGLGSMLQPQQDQQQAYYGYGAYDPMQPNPNQTPRSIL